jgi:tetratricopeptide (TPR) repeat protein
VEWLLRVSDKLDLLRELDPHFEIFGANEHRYQLTPSLDPEVIVAFEAEHKIQLPAEYRDFLRYLGDGGAGPFYGLYALAETFHNRWVELGPLSQPFPLNESCNIDEKIGEEVYSEFIDRCRQGVLLLAHEGSGYFALLVVSGEARGEIWHDLTTGDGGFQKTDKTFAPWYEDWLDYSIAQRKKTRQSYRSKAERLQKALQQNPNSPKAHFELAELYLFSAGKKKQAEEFYRQSLQLYSEYVPAAERLSGLLLERGAWEEIRDLVEQVLPKADLSWRPWLLTRLGVALFHLGEAALAIDLLQQAISLEIRVTYDPADRVHLTLAQACKALGDFEEARSQLRSAPLSPAVHYELGLVHYELGLYKEALQHFEQVPPGQDFADLDDWLQLTEEALL